MLHHRGAAFEQELGDSAPVLWRELDAVRRRRAAKPTSSPGDVAVEGVPVTLDRAIVSWEGGDGSEEVGGCAMLVLASGYLLEVVRLVVGRRSVSRP